MAGILEAVTQVVEIFEMTSKEGFTAKSFLKAIKSDNIQLVRSDGSMLKILGNYIIEPALIVSKDLKGHEIMDGLTGLQTDTFASFYMQVMDILRMHYNMSDREVIDILATDNGGMGRVLLRGTEIAIENHDYFGALDGVKLNFQEVEVSTERRDTSTKTHKALQDEKRKNNRLNIKNITTTIGSDHSNKLSVESQQDDDRKYDLELYNMKKANDKNYAKELDNFKTANKKELERYKGVNQDIEITPSGVNQQHKDLLIPNALMRTIEVTFVKELEENDQGRNFGRLTITIPITIKTHLIYTDIDTILNAADPHGEHANFFNRLDEYKAGAISLTDLLFASDLISRYKNNKLKDKDDLLKFLQSRRLSANSKLATGKGIGFEKNYNMYVITADDAVKLSAAMRGKISKEKYKDKFLEVASGLMLTVVDMDYERVTMLVRDIRGHSDLSFKGVIKNERGGGNDLSEIVKALVANRPATF